MTQTRQSNYKIHVHKYTTTNLTQVMVTASFAIYGVLIGLAEVLIVFQQVEFGVTLHFALLGLLLTHTVLAYKLKAHQFYLALSLAPITRILIIFGSTLGLPFSFWFWFVCLSLYGAVIILVKALNIHAKEMGINTNNLPIQLPIGLLGFPLGYAGYYILKPLPVSSLGVEEVLLPAIILIFAGFTEELVFRGVMLPAALKTINRTYAVVFISLICSFIYFGTLQPYFIVFAFGVSILFSIFFVWQKTIIGIALAHGFYNLTVYIICPNILGNTAVKLSTPVDITQIMAITGAVSGYGSQIGYLVVVFLVVFLITAELCGAVSERVTTDNNQFVYASRVIYVGVIPLFIIFASMVVQKVQQVMKIIN